MELSGDHLVRDNMLSKDRIEQSQIKGWPVNRDGQAAGRRDGPSGKRKSNLHILLAISYN